LDAGVAALKRAKANLKRYRASVLKSAVEGKLTEQWRAKHPAKEPASALLAHILLERRQKWEADQLAKFAAAKKEPPKNWRDKYVQPSPPDSTCLQELPEGWCWGSLEQLTSAVRPICYGILMPKENVAEGVPYVRVKDMKGDRIDVLNLHRTRPEIAAEYARATLIPGDWLLAIRGTYGRLAEVPPELEGGNITQDTARLAVANDISAGFVATALRSSLCQLFFKRVARGVAVKGVNIGDVRLCPIPIGPKEEQLQILQMVSERLSQIDAAEKQIEHGLLRASRLRQSILKRAFEGKLVPQDPKDEPASALLERLRTSRTHDEANGTAATSKPNRAKIKESSGEPRTQIRRRASTRNQQEE
jgi:type I restriction enzyme S subunit